VVVTSCFMLSSSIGSLITSAAPRRWRFIPTQPQTTVEAEEIQSVLSSETFLSSPRLSRLLSYLCSNHFSENPSFLNEYRIGVEALGRPADFDPSKNSSVRVEVHRLRTKLRGYYDTEGANHAVRIILDDGHYGIQFVPRDAVASDASEGSQGFHIPTEVHVGTLASNSSPAVLEGCTRARVRPPFPAKSVAIAAAAVVVAIVAVVGIARELARAKFAHTSSLPPRQSLGVVPVAIADKAPILILAGYQKEKYIDRDGNAWGGDRYFHGGEAVELNLPYIQGAVDTTLYRTARTGEFSYDIPVKPGRYELRLHFVETIFGPGTYAGRGESSRLFSVLLNEQPLLLNFDILSEAGGPYQAFTRVFKGVSPGSDGMVHLRFVRDFDQPLVNAIELAPMSGNKMNPVRIVMQPNSYVDHAGNVWGSDQYAVGGVLGGHQKTPVATSDPHLFDGERFGHFTYQIPVAPGRYTVSLYFTEAFYGTVMPPPDNGAGRVFDVYSNGVALLRNFDIYASAGGPNKPVSQTFKGIEPNEAGLIVLSFVPVRNYACVNAIEVTDESP